LYITERKANGIVILYVQFITLSLTFHFYLDFPKCLFLSGFQTKIVLCIFNISGAFLLSHLSHCLSVHSQPTITHQYKPYGFPLCNFVHPLLLPLSSDQLSPSAPGLTQYLKCIVLWNTNTNTHHPTHNSL